MKETKFKKTETRQTAGGQVGEIPEGWKKFRLGDYIDIKHGFAFKGEFFSENPTRDILVTPGNFYIGGGFKDTKLKYYFGEYPKEYILDPGDIIITMTDLSRNGDTLGYAAMVPAKKDNRFLHNQRIGLVKFKTKEIEKDFLYWALRTKKYQNHIVNSASGSTVKHTSPGRIKEWGFYAPVNLSEQKAIAKIFGDLDEKIEINNRMNKTLEAMGQALFKRWFIDFEFPNEKGKPYKSSGGKMADSELGEIPKDWKIQPIGELTQVVGGSTPSTSESTYWEGGEYFWATPKDLSMLQSPVLLNTERKITEAGLGEIGSGVLPSGTLLLSSRAPIGYLAISEVPVAINQGFIAMQPKESISNLFLLFWTKSAMNKIKSQANGSTFLEINKASFRKIPVCVPKNDSLANFERIIRPIYKQIFCNVKESEALSCSRNSLLPKLMSGEIGVI